MAKGKPTDERNRLLHRLRRRRFDRIRFRGLDAVVTQVVDSPAMPPAVQAAMDQGLPQRWYPVEGGDYLVKWPHTGAVDLVEGFWVEPGGWDHEHCSACNRHIEVGRTFWQTAHGSCIWLCPYCYRRVRQLSRA
jgi:hypothetical protein